MRFPQDVVKVLVDYYDIDEESKFAQFPNAARIAELAGAEIEIPTNEFLTYYMFRRKRPGMPGLRNYRELASKMETSLRDLEGSVVFDGKTIHVAGRLGELDSHIAERIGEAAGLSVINRIHGMTEADWGRVPKGSGRNAGPSLDFEIGSDSRTLIQVETKGSYVPNNDRKTSTVSNHKASVLSKKGRLAGAIHPSRRASVVRYGTIGVVGDPGHLLRCWLLDPPPDELTLDPERVRLLNRMAFLRDWISLVSARSTLAVALANRLGDLETMINPWELDGVPLRRGDGEPLELSFGMWPRERSTFFSNKSVVTDGPTGGVVIQGYGSRLFFVGMREDVLQLAAKQDFKGIAQYVSSAGSIRKRIECRVGENRFRQMRLPDGLRAAAERIGGYRRFQLWCELQFTNTGVAFGELETVG